MRPTQYDPNSEQEAAENKQSMLPKPLRTFSYFFFGIVFVVGIVGWFVTSGR